jgi:predicted O-methyltransferase YrrM
MNFRQKIFQIKKFFKYYFSAITQYNVQSPFLHKFLTEVLDTKKQYYIFSSIENERNLLLKNTDKIQRQDFGAGSISKNKPLTTEIKNLAKYSLSGQKQCRILFNLVIFKQPECILEMGTSLGISTSYLASAKKNAALFTMEGDPAVAAVAKMIFHRLHLHNISLVEGKFSNTLPVILQSCTKLDMVFIDGHHDEEATVVYFNQILKKCHPYSVIIIDDIYWSEGMSNAWNQIKLNPEVSLTIDLYFMGIVFTDKALSKEDLVIIPYLYKPWKTGLFGNS